jgi:two-component system nitrate/nitrite response regulator NarP
MSRLERDAGIAVAAGVVTGDKALEAIRQYEPDVAVLSLHLPSGGALNMLATLAGESSNTRSVVLAAQLNQVEFLRAMRLGVRGIVFEEMPAAVLVRCVQLVCAGGDFWDRQLVLAAFRRAPREGGVRADVTRLLTAREHAVVEQAVSGLRNKEIARRLGLTEGTVKSHLHRAYHKLQIQSRFALIERTGWTGHFPSRTALARTR